MSIASHDEFKELLTAALDGQLSRVEFDRLQARLKSDSELRQGYIDHLLLDAQLADEFSTDAVRGMVDMVSSTTIKQTKGSLISAKGRRYFRLGGIAAGIILSVVLASATIAYALPLHRPQFIAVESLLNPGFELPELTDGGFPRVTGRWSGDDSKITVLENTAKEGTHALCFNRAQGNENATSGPTNFCDVFQLVDLRPFRAVANGKETLLEFSVDFLDARSSGEPLWHMVKIYLFEGDPETVYRLWPANLTECVGSNMEFLSSSGARVPEWKTVTARCVISRMADFAVLQIGVGNLPHERKTPSPLLEKQYADNARLNLVIRPQTGPR